LGKVENPKKEETEEAITKKLNGLLVANAGRR
jgi:hypothetical protein